MEVTEERVKVKILKAVLSKSELGYAKDALDYINILEKQLAIQRVSGSFNEELNIDDHLQNIGKHRKEATYKAVVEFIKQYNNQ